MMRGHNESKRVKQCGILDRIRAFKMPRNSVMESVDVNKIISTFILQTLAQRMWMRLHENGPVETTKERGLCASCL